MSELAAFRSKVSAARAERGRRIKRLEQEAQQRSAILREVCEGLELGLLSDEEALDKALRWAGPLTWREIIGLGNIRFRLLETRYRRVVVDRISEQLQVVKETAFAWRADGAER